MSAHAKEQAVRPGSPPSGDSVTVQKPSATESEKQPPPTDRDSSGDQGVDADRSAPADAAPTSAPYVAEKWNLPRGNMGRLVFVFLSFAVAGLNDGAVGALLPYIEQYYGLDYTTVSLIFLTPFVGYSVAAFVNARIHVRFGQRGIAFMAPLCHVVAYAIISAHPPFPVLIVVNVLSGFGNGLLDACFCSWVGVMDKANSLQGLMHSMYSLGALFAPIIATELVVTHALPWYTFYFVLVGICVLELVGLCVFFWKKTGTVYRASHEHEHGGEAKGAGTRDALRSRVTWLCSLFFFTYMGAEVGLGGWIVTFMLRVRQASPYAAGISGSGFWAGMALGRAVLGFVTERFGERICIAIYLVASLALQLIFWLVPSFIASAVAVAFLGFFLGPMFPGAVIMAAKLLPRRIHVSAIGFAMAVGGTGGTVFPFIVGAIATQKGVEVLQPIVLALIAVVGIIWLLFPRIKKEDQEETV